MAFDYKKEFKDLYRPKTTPSVLTVPPMNFLAVKGAGDPNEENSEYKQSIELLYGIAYTLRMSAKAGHAIDGFFEYVVCPLEGLWMQNGTPGAIDYSRKADFEFVSMMRVPDFICQQDVDWAKEQAAKKKNKDFSKVEFLSFDEGLCVQCMHIGPYDLEPATIEKMNAFLEKQGYESDFSASRLHHEIYLSDPRRTAPEKLKTVIRHPIRKKQ